MFRNNFMLCFFLKEIIKKLRNILLYSFRPTHKLLQDKNKLFIETIRFILFYVFNSTV